MILVRQIEVLASMIWYAFVSQVALVDIFILNAIYLDEHFDMEVYWIVMKCKFIYKNSSISLDGLKALTYGKLTKLIFELISTKNG